MNTDEASAVRELFDHAVELPPEGRAAFLDQRCPDSRLRAQVDRLLAAESSTAAQGFLPAPPAEPERTVGALLSDAAAVLKRDALAGQRIGRYHIKSLLGVGGMARVYEAVQEQPHRVVALKVMNQHVTARSALRRFQYESQILGRLRHPNIAQIYEAGVAAAGTSGGVEIPYFAMEYLPGARPITRYVLEKGLDVRRRVELFIKVCDAVHYGHQRGVIHRDLKPANLLVEASGEPKIIDFGVARGTDSDTALTMQQTHLGELVGTMQYMSPEQCDGDPHEIDTRSDVYSLGVVLYEVLTGSPPYSVADSTIYQATRIIKEQLPARPSTVAGVQPGLARGLRGDLDTIVLKAIEKDRDRRYASAAALADDLRRALAGDPIHARRPTVSSRVTRWIFRRPAAAMFVAGAATSAVLLASTVVLSRYWSGYWSSRYWSHQAARIQVADDGFELRIFAHDGTPVFSSGRANTRVFHFAEILDPGKSTDPPRPLLVGATAAFAGFERGLNILDADGDLSRPQQVLRVQQEHLPPILQERSDSTFEPDLFGVQRALVADVFPEIPGGEIVVAFQHEGTTQTMIAIFDLTWKRRYCVWADCQVNDLHWLSGAGQLVILGCNGLYFLHERGLKHGKQSNHPLVVFAIKPELDYRVNRYVAQEQSAQSDADPQLCPVWYRMLPSDLTVITQSLRARPAREETAVCKLYSNSLDEHPTPSWA